jgi:hypothetical protein
LIAKEQNHTPRHERSTRAHSPQAQPLERRQMKKHTRAYL